MNIESEAPPYFVFPRAQAYTDPAHAYRGTHRTYAHYNYLRPGVVARLKRRRFEIALAMAVPWFHRSAVIDFGCGDGVFLPSLARYFPSVSGIDRNPEACAVADQMVRELSLMNVHVWCADTVPADLPAGTERHGLMFLMETIEHACAPDAARIALIEGLFQRLDANGQIILSVPRTTGLAFLAKHVAQRLNGIRDEPMTLREVWRAAVRADTRDLERRWAGGHLGFNDVTFDRSLHDHFQVLEQRHTLLSIVYRVARR